MVLTWGSEKCQGMRVGTNHEDRKRPPTVPSGAQGELSGQGGIKIRPEKLPYGSGEERGTHIPAGFTCYKGGPNGL